MVHRACEIETEIISGFGEGRHGPGCRGSITDREDFRKHILVLYGGNYVEPDAENVRVLAVMFLRRRICQQTVLLIPAEIVHGPRRADSISAA